jgi:uncharacterized membrane-anchored protein
MQVRSVLRWWLVAAVAVLAMPVAQAQQGSTEAAIRALPWQTAPAEGAIASVAHVALTGGLRFLDETASSRFVELNGNPPRSGIWVLAPARIDWFAVFSFNRMGYVRDDERLDADALLRALQQGDEGANAERRRLGMPTMRVDGWAVEPHYDAGTRRLEWATRLIDERGDVVVNHTTRILGRTGVMSVTLVSDPVNLTEDLRQFRTALAGLAYDQGETYAEYRTGDRVAQYGLAGLVLGGAMAAGAGSALKGFGKMIGLGVLAAAAAAWVFVKRIFVRDDRPPGS